jgi:hypothetical protein
MAKYPVLTATECDILDAGLADANVISGYFFSTNPGTEPGFQFDYKFEPQGIYQHKLHHASQTRLIVVGGFGSGKTLAIGMSASIYALVTPDFKFLNAAPQQKQAKAMYEHIITVTRGTRFEELIFNDRESPYPFIELRFIYRGKLMISTLEFMSAAKNAENILAWEGDWANLDEAGLMDDLSKLRRNLGSRVRGNVRGRYRLGRLSFTTNSWYNPEFWAMYDMAQEDPENYLSVTVFTEHNKNITDKQLEMIMKDIPQDEHDQFLRGGRPKGRGDEFDEGIVLQCESIMMDELVNDMQKRGAGVAIRRKRAAGITYLTMPRIDDRDYILIGDLGKGNAPFRDAPVLQVWDVSNVPARMVAFYWGNGKGTIHPFVRELVKLAIKYRPIYIGVDNTGPQAGTVEMINHVIQSDYILSSSAGFRELGIEVAGKMTAPATMHVSGMGFGGGKKVLYLMACQAALAGLLLTWPQMIKGMRSQLLNYSLTEDRRRNGKLAQDLVATTAMAAYVIVRIFNSRDLDDDEEQDKKPDEREQKAPDRSGRLQRSAREGTRVPR